MYIACLVIVIYVLDFIIQFLQSLQFYLFFLFQILNFLSSSHFIWSALHHISGELLSNSQVTRKYNHVTGLSFFFWRGGGGRTCLKNIGLWLWLTVETTFFSDSAVAQAVIHWLSTTVVSVRSQGGLCWIYAGKSGTGIDFSPSTQILPIIYHSVKSSYYSYQLGQIQ